MERATLVYIVLYIIFINVEVTEEKEGAYLLFLVGLVIVTGITLLVVIMNILF